MLNARDLVEFLLLNKKYWVAPAVAQTALFAILLLLSQGSAVAPLPFIYGVF